MPLFSTASPLEAYNSLMDKHLVNYFSTNRMKKHLIDNGLITENDEVVSEAEYKEIQNRENQKRAILQIIAHAIIEKSLEVERIRQGKLQRNLEEICRLHRIRKLKEERQKHYEEFLLSKLVAKSPRSSENLQPLGIYSPGNIKSQSSASNIDGNIRTIRYSKMKDHYDGQYNPLLVKRQRQQQSLFKKSPRKNNKSSKTSLKHSRHKSCDKRDRNEEEGRQVIGDFHDTNKEEFKSKNDRIHTTKNESINIHEISVSHDENANKKAKKIKTSTDKQKQTSKNKRNQTSCIVKFMYLGVSRSEVSKTQDSIDRQKTATGRINSVNVSNPSSVRLITVIQQPNGGNTHTVFKGLLQPGDIFQITSRRVYGFPFSLTFYVDGKQYTRISTCCEYRHKTGIRLGGKNGHFLYLTVEGSFPCYKCQTAKAWRSEMKARQRAEKSSVNNIEEQTDEDEIDRFEADEEEELKAYEDDFEIEEKNSVEGKNNNTDGIPVEHVELIHSSGINKIHITTIQNEKPSMPIQKENSDSTSSSSSTLSTHFQTNEKNDHLLPSTLVEDTVSEGTINKTSEIDFMEYFKAALHSLVLNDTNNKGSLRCIIWLSIKLKTDTHIDENSIKLNTLKDDKFCEAIIRQEDNQVIRVALPKPKNSDKLKLRWPLNDLEVTDRIKYVDFCNLSNILSMPLSTIDRLELCLEVPEKDVIYKFIEHSSLSDSHLITFKNPMKIVLNDEDDDQCDDNLIFGLLYELANRLSDDEDDDERKCAGDILDSKNVQLSEEGDSVTSDLQQSLTEEKTSDINDQHSSSITPSLPSDYLNTTMMMDLNKSSVPFIDSHDDNNLENVSNSIFKQSECELDMMNNSDSKLMSFNESIIELETFSIYPPTDQVNDEYNTLENNVGKMIFLSTS
ncbi:unnamed protein product [Heterobilharzia americana]|nr:unnamed protein product [Heterobilharzia americana]